MGQFDFAHDCQLSFRSEAFFTPTYFSNHQMRAVSVTSDKTPQSAKEDAEGEDGSHGRQEREEMTETSPSQQLDQMITSYWTSQAIYAAAKFGIPEGADTYLMRHIIHDWDDEKSLTILRNCHAVLPADGKLLVVESVIPPGNQRFAGKFLDLVMLLIPGGKERTEAEYRVLFDEAGFELSRIVPTNTELSIVEGVRR